jgi:hypothetical protein
MSKLHEVEIQRLHPTQITVGMIEVRDKRTQLAELHREQLLDFLSSHPIPAVDGPNDKLYITDHHHLARALSEEKVASGFFLVEADFSTLALDAFWLAMDRNHWVHPYDEHGVLRTFGDIPNSVDDLKDDPYRSVAGYVRNAGGFQKTAEVYAEFQWADFFRARVVIGAGDQAFHTAVEQGIALAHSEAAQGLPGYRGP